MSFHQTGPKPAKVVNSPNPLGVREGENQKETSNAYGFRMDMGGKMPDISYTTKHSGKIGSTSPVTVKPLRQEYDVKVSNPEENFHTQYVKEGEIEHSPGAFNK